VLYKLCSNRISSSCFVFITVGLLVFKLFKSVIIESAVWDNWLTWLLVKLHISPVNPLIQEQLILEFMSREQVPPFKQGFGVQLEVEAKY